MMDLCVLYGGREPQQGNTQLLTKMLTNVFTKQPKYTEDLQRSAEAVITAFDKLKERVVSQEDSLQRKDNRCDAVIYPFSHLPVSLPHILLDV
jgi:hypothetical protein